MFRALYLALFLALLLNWQPECFAAENDVYALKANRDLIGQVAVLARQEKYEQVLSLALANLAAADQKYGKNNKLSADLLMFASVGYQNTGRIRKAKEYYELASQRQLAVYGAASLQFAGLLNNFGNFLEESGDLRGAEAAFRQSLDAKRRVDGPRIEILPSTLLNLAEVYIQLNSLDEATRLLEEGYMLLKGAPRQKLHLLTDVLINLAEIAF
jgi:Tfp pilus assembly protein PilF